MTLDLSVFAPLSDSAHVRILPVDGDIAPDRLAPFVGVLTALMDQWRGNGAIRQSAVAATEDGRFIVVAYEPVGGEVSGCTKDGLTHTVLEFEKHLGIRSLNAPKAAVEIDGAVRFLTPTDFRNLANSGQITEKSRVYDHLVTTLGDVRGGRFATVAGASWYARLLPAT